MKKSGNYLPWVPVLLAGFLTVGCGSQRAPAGPPPLPAGRTYLAVGDSITGGIFASDYEHCFAYLLWEDLNARYPEVTFVNMGRGGSTALSYETEFIPEIQSEIFQSSFLPDGTDFITVQIGLNDLIHSNAPGDPLYAESVYGMTAAQALPYSLKFKRRLKRGILEPLRRLSRNSLQLKIVLANIYDNGDYGSPPFWRSAYWPEGHAVFQLYNRRIAEVAREEMIPLVDLDSLFHGKGDRYLFEDGVHPNDQGHAAIAQAFGPYF